MGMFDTFLQLSSSYHIGIIRIRFTGILILTISCQSENLERPDAQLADCTWYYSTTYSQLVQSFYFWGEKMSRIKENNGVITFYRWMLFSSRIYDAGDGKIPKNVVY